VTTLRPHFRSDYGQEAIRTNGCDATVVAVAPRTAVSPLSAPCGRSGLVDAVGPYRKVRRRSSTRASLLEATRSSATAGGGRAAVANAHVEPLLPSSNYFALLFPRRVPALGVVIKASGAEFDWVDLPATAQVLSFHRHPDTGSMNLSFSGTAACHAFARTFDCAPRSGPDLYDHVFCLANDLLNSISQPLNRVLGNKMAS
jgi:hypothetical protein